MPNEKVVVFLSLNNFISPVPKLIAELSKLAVLGDLNVAADAKEKPFFTDADWVVSLVLEGRLNKLVLVLTFDCIVTFFSSGISFHFDESCSAVFGYSTILGFLQPLQPGQSSFCL